jgi:hypothetical protein
MVKARGDQETSWPARGGLLIVGFALLFFSLWSLFENVTISGGLLSRWGLGDRGFGWSLAPLMAGIVWVVASHKSFWAWALIVVGVAIIFLEVISSLTFYFRPISLNTLLIILVPGFVGLALVGKNL